MSAQIEANRDSVNIRHVRSARGAMLRLREQSSLEDLVLVSGTNKVYAHRLLMAAASQFIYQQLQACDFSSHPVPVNLPPMDVSTINVLVEFAYTGRINVCSRKVGQIGAVLEAARALQMHNLYQRCVALLHVAMSPSTVVEIWQLADNCEDPELQGSCISYLAQHMATRFRTTRYLSLPFERFQIVFAHASASALLSREQLLRAAICWVNHSRSTRKELLQELLSCLQVSQHTTSDLLLASSNDFVDEESQISLVQKDKEPCNSEGCHLEQRDSLTLIAEKTLSRKKSEKLDTTEKFVQTPNSIYNSMLYLFSLSKDNKILFENYNFETNKWHTVEFAGTDAVTEGTTCTLFNGVVYFIGGECDNSDKLGTCHAYDITGSRFYAIATMHVAKAWAGATSLDSSLYCAGGKSKYQRPLSHVEFYSPSRDVWRVAAPMRRARYRPALSSANGRVYALGGNNGSDWLSSCEIYEPMTNEWTEIAPLDKEILSGPFLLTSCESFLIAARRDHMKTVHYFDSNNFMWKPAERTVGTISGQAEILTECQGKIFLLDDRKVIYTYNNRTWEPMTNSSSPTVGYSFLFACIYLKGLGQASCPS